jgi:hypothetical protein
MEIFGEASGGLSMASELQTGKARRKEPYRLSKRLLIALEALSNGSAESLSQAAQISGLTERAIRYSLAKPHIRSWIRQNVSSTLAGGQLLATKTLLGLLKGSNEMSKFRIASWIMGVNGVAPVDNRGPLVNIDMRSGFQIDLREPDEVHRPLTAHDSAALEGIRSGGAARVTLLGSRGVGPVIEGEARELTAPARVVGRERE